MNSTARNIRSVGSKQVARTHSDAAEPTATPAVTPQIEYLPILSENGSPDNSDTPSATQDATSSLIGIAPGGSGSGPDGSTAVTYLRCSRCEEGIPVDVVPAVDAFRGLPVCDRCARAQRHVRRAARCVLALVLLVPANTYCLDATERVSSGATAECSGWGATVAEASPPDPRQCETGRSGMAFESGSKNQTVWSRAEKVGAYCLERDGSTGRGVEEHAREWATHRTDEVPGPCLPTREGTPQSAGIKPGRPVEPSVSTPLAIYTASAGLDYASTRYAMSQGARERNPLIGQSHARLIALKALQAGALTYLDVKLQRNHPGKAKALRIAAVAVNGALAFHNLRVAQRQRGMK